MDSRTEILAALTEYFDTMADGRGGEPSYSGALAFVEERIGGPMGASEEQTVFADAYYSQVGR